MFQTYSWRALRLVFSHLAKSYILLSSGYVNYAIQIKFNDIIQQKCNILYMFSTTLPPSFSVKFVVFCIVVFHQCVFLSIGHYRHSSISNSFIPLYCHENNLRLLLTYPFGIVKPAISIYCYVKYLQLS